MEKNFQKEPSVPNSIGEDCRYLSILSGQFDNDRKISVCPIRLTAYTLKTYNCSHAFFYILLNFITFSLFKTTRF